MRTARRFRALVAPDGSAGARAAVAMTVAFPWPEPSLASAVLAPHETMALAQPATVREAVEAGLRRVAEQTRRMLARRWPAASVAIVRRPPADAILREAERVRARAIVVGCRGHGAVGRLLLGSVSRQVVRQASVPTLVVKGRPPRAVRRLVVGFDGSPNARRAIDVVAGLDVPSAGRVTLVQVVAVERAPSRPLLPPAALAIVRSRIAVLNAERIRTARRQLETAARELRRAGWTVRTVVRSGVPLTELLATARGAHVLVVGARGTGGLQRLLLGSVAEGVLNHATGPVLIVR